MDPLILFVVFLVRSHFSLRHGLVGGLSDFFVLGVGQVYEDIPRLRGPDTADGADGGKQ